MQILINDNPIFYIYNKKSSDTLVVMLHGLTMDSYMYPFNDLANDIYKLGFDVLRFDFIGHGKSYGESKDMTIKKEIDDAISVINYFKRDYDKLIILGHSQGGLIASYLAGIFNPYRLVLLAPGYNLRDCVLNKNFFGKKIIENKPVHIWNMTFSKEYLDDIVNEKYYILKYDGKVTIIHGDKDILCPVRYSIDMANRYKNIILNRIEESDHEFIDYYDELFKFVKEALV